MMFYLVAHKKRKIARIWPDANQESSQIYNCVALKLERIEFLRKFQKYAMHTLDHHLQIRIGGK